MARSVLVTGGTGTLGKAVVRRLFEDGNTVRVLSRRDHTDVAEVGITLATGDLTTGAGLADAVAGVDTIVHCATTLGKRDVSASANLLRAVQDSGATPHLVYISIVGIDRVPLGYYRAKLEVEGLIERTPIPWTILRATQFHDLLTKLFSLQRRLPATIVPSGTGFQTIDVRDVATRLGELVDAGPSGRVADIGGPTVRSADDLARAYLSHVGRRRPVVGLRLPTKIGTAYRDGEHLTPEHRYGTITYEQYLTDQVR